MINEFKINFEWEDPLAARGNELRPTWARFQIFVNNVNITKVEDILAKSVRDAIYLPLYPIAEWIASNWWSLLYEIKSPILSEDKDYSRRHCLINAAEGFAIPSLNFESEGDLINLNWDSSFIESANVKFITYGKYYVHRKNIEAEFEKFLKAVILRLETFQVKDTFLQKEFMSIKDSSEEESEFCISAAKIGSDPYSLSEDESKKLVDTLDKIPAGIREELLPATEISKIESDMNTVNGFIESSKKNESNLESLINLKKTMGLLLNGNSLPWEQGYEFAKRLRRNLKRDEILIKSTDNLTDFLGIASKGWADSFKELPIDKRRIDSLLAFNKNNSPVFGMRKFQGNDSGKMLSICRTLFEFLKPDFLGSSIVTKSHSDNQKRNRAFAAELLAPEELLRKQLSTTYVTMDDIDEIAAEFGTSQNVIRHQIENHKLARIENYDY